MKNDKRNREYFIRIVLFLAMQNSNHLSSWNTVCRIAQDPPNKAIIVLVQNNKKSATKKNLSSLQNLWFIIFD